MPCLVAYTKNPDPCSMRFPDASLVVIVKVYDCFRDLGFLNPVTINVYVLSFVPVFDDPRVY